MASYNKVILMGNLTRDPELRSLPSGMSVARIGIGPKMFREQPLADFVLGRLTPEEQALFAARTPDYIYGLELLASRGLVAAQNTLNKHTKP